MGWHGYPGAAVRFLLTNDDGIGADGLRALVPALAAHGEVVVIAPLENQSGVARKITLSRPLAVDEVAVPGATAAFAVDGTPVDCVRLGVHGLAGPPPDVIVSGANHGLNLGDDVTYSGTVAAAFEGHLLGLPAIAVSQQSTAGELGFLGGAAFDFTHAARFVDRLRRGARGRRLPAGAAAERQRARRHRRAARCWRGSASASTATSWSSSATTPAAATPASTAPPPASSRARARDCQAIADGLVAITPLRLELDLPDAAELASRLDLDGLV